MNAQNFLDAMASTANDLNLNEHMNLISKEVSVFGVPGFEVIGYQDWFNQCQHEFENKLLKRKNQVFGVQYTDDDSLKRADCRV